MAKQTKMNAELAKRVKELGINAKSEEDAREKLLDILTENGIEGMEEEDTDTLIEIAESFVEETQTAEEEADESEVEEQTEEEEAEELAEEAAEEEAAEESDEAEEETEEEEAEEEEAEEVEEEADEYDEMDRKELKKFIADNGLEVKVTKSKSDDDIRDEVRNAMADKEVASKKEEKKNAKKEEKKSSKKEEKSEEKPAKKSARKITKLSPKENKDDRQFFNFLKKVFPDGEYEFAWVTGGVSVKYVGKNGRRNIMSAKNCSMQENGNIKCNVYLPTLCKKTEVLDNANLDYSICFSGDPFLNGVILQDIVSVFEDLKDEMLGVVKKIDKKLGDNREKMEKELEKNKKPAKKEEKKAEKTEEKVEKKPAKKAKK
jgi:chemotaxis protein histidine kinase CheA